MPRRSNRRKKVSFSTDSEASPEPKRIKMADQVTPAQASTTASTSDVMNDILQKLTALTSKVEKISSVEEKLTELQKSVEFVSKSFDDFKKDIDNVKSLTTQLKQDNESLQGQLQATQRELTVTREELNELQQYSRRNNIEISGIPQHEGENTDDIVMKIAGAVGVKVTPEDIDISHRLPRRHQDQRGQVQHPPIIVKFTRRTIRNKIYYSRQQLKDKTPRQLHLDDQSTNRIYINENLTPTTKRLFHQVNERRKHLKWKFIWTSNGKIYVRKNEDAESIMISSLQSVNRIV